MSIEIKDLLLPYNDRLQAREVSSLDLVVLHCTELPTLEMAREYGERILYPESGTGASGHIYIDRDGSVFRYATDDRVAQHTVGYNQTSIGIELVNTGRYPRWFFATHQRMEEPYGTAQLNALRDVLREYNQRYPSLKQLARHSDLDTRTVPAEDDAAVQVRRRMDPGPLFPWEDFLAFWTSL